MKNYDEVRNVVKSRLSEYRFYHSECVAKRCCELAEQYGVDIEKARLVGIVHDIAKEMPNDEKIQYCRENSIEIDEMEMENPGLLHGIIGGDIAKKEFGFDDEMCFAITCHNTGRANMSLLGKILIISDKSGDDRDFPDLDYVRKLSKDNLEECVMYILEYEIVSRIKKRQKIHVNSIITYNDLLNNFNK